MMHIEFAGSGSSGTTGAPRIRRWGCAVSCVVAAALLLSARGAHAAAATDLVLRVTSTSFRVGTNGIYNITVSNRGADTDDVTTLTDQLPDGLSFGSSRSSTWDCAASGQLITCTHADPISAGTNASLMLSVGVGEAARPSVSNSFHLTYAGDTNLANNTVTRTSIVKAGLTTTTPATPTRTPTVGTPLPTATRTNTGAPTSTHTPIPASTDLLIGKTSVGTFVVGAQGTYVLTVSNVGTLSTNAPIAVTDILPIGLGFASADASGWSCSASGQQVTCTTPDPLAAGTSTSVVLTVSIGSGAYPSVTNTASVSYAGDTNNANNTAHRPTTVRRGSVAASTATPTVAGPGPLPTSTATATRTTIPTAGTAAATDLGITKSLGGIFRVGVNGTYILKVSNLGTVSTTAPITVTDSLPTGMTFVSATGTGWTCSAAAPVVTCNYPSALGPSSSTTFTLTVDVGSAAVPTVTNSATVFYAGDTNTANNTAHKPTTVRQ